MEAREMPHDVDGSAIGWWEACTEHRGPANAPCSGCGWLAEDHDRSELAPVIDVGTVRPRELLRAS
jgi:hypothetical protein